MKKLFLILTLCTCSFVSKAQQAQVERTMFGLETGLTGLWVYNESRLAPQFTLKSKFGFNSLLYTSTSTHTAGFFSTPEVALEPRFYYNLLKRQSNNKNIASNSANFVSIKFVYNTDHVLFSSYNGETAPPTMESRISIIPTWGIRRAIGKKFYYEVGAGFGYSYFYDSHESGIAADLHIKLGFRL